MKKLSADGMASPKGKQVLLHPLFIYMVFFMIIFVIHLPWKIVCDDTIRIAETYDSVWSLMKTTWSSWNGKYLSETLGVVLLHIPFIVWKAADSFLYCVIAETIFYLSGAKQPWKRILIACCLLMFPFEWLSSAGYVMTSANYVYPFAGLLFACIPLAHIARHQKSSPGHFLLAIFGGAIAGNQEQTMAALLLICICLTCCLALCRREKGAAVITAAWLTLYAFQGAFFFLSPGHLSRMNSTGETEYWLPQYLNWSWEYKLFRGVSSTLATLFFSDWALILLLLTLILVTGIMRRKVIGILPFGGLLAVKAIGYNQFIMYYDYTWEMPDVILPEVSPSSSLAFLLASLFLSSTILISVYQITAGPHRPVLISLLVIGFISRALMGFSGTLYASSFRTFSLMSFFIIIVCAYLLCQLVDDINRRTVSQRLT